MELHEFGPKEFSSRSFGPVRISGDFSARAQSHLMNYYKKILFISIVVGTFRSAEQDDAVLSRNT